MKGRRSPRLVLGVYAFSVILIVTVISAFVLIPRYLLYPPWLSTQAALVQVLVNQGAQSDRVSWPDVFVGQHGKPVVRGEVVLYDAALTKVYASPGRKDRTVSSDADRSPPRPDELKGEEAVRIVSAERAVIRADNGKYIAVFTPYVNAFPWQYFAPFMAVVLVVVLAASFWFARRMARPLTQLTAAAQKLGQGDLSARTQLSRADEFGDVGRAFDNMADRLQRMIAGQRQLLADVSHELRTPMARMRVALELASEDPAAAREMMTSITADLSEVETLIDDILTTSRLDGELALRIAALPLPDLIERCRKRFGELHKGHRLTVDANTLSTTNAALCECEPVLLRRAIDNLLDNAARYSEGNPEIVLRVKSDGNAATFTVEDRGVGMTADELANAFTPFWRADASRQRQSGGVGLGLALARRIAQAHLGEVALRSTPGKGTSAMLHIPLRHT